MKNINLCTLLVLLSLFAFCPETEGQGFRKIYDVSPVDQEAFTLLATADGGYLMEGRFHIKTDADGNQQWANEAAHPTSNFGNRHAVLFDDGSYAVIHGSGFPFVASVGKYDAFGNEIFNQPVSLPALDPQELHIVSIDRTADGGFVALFNFLDGSPCGCNGYVLLKYDENGTLEWEAVNDEATTHQTFSVKALSDGGFAISGQWGDGLLEREAYVEKRDANGNPLWERTWLITGNDQFASVIETSDGNIVAAGYGNLSSSPASLVKLSQTGDEIWFRDWAGLFNSRIQDVKEMPDGNLVMVGDNGFANGLILFTDPDGIELWRRNFTDDNFEERFYSVQPCPDGGLAIAGEQEGDCLLLKTDGMGNVYTHKVFGKVFVDDALDCNFDGTETGLGGWLVTATGDDVFYVNTNADGEYSIHLDTGEYELSITPFGPWENCQPSYAFTATNVYDSTEIHLPLQPDGLCPLLEVDISTPFIRPCSLGFYAVHYCNLGTQMATDATIEVELADGLTYDGTLTGTLLSQNGQTLLFGLGDVGINECGSFTFSFMTDCDPELIGETLCTEAHIFPDTACLEITAMPQIEVTGQCENDSVKFEIKNIGEDMPEIFEYIIIEDNIILMQGNFQLLNQEIQTAAEEAMSGSTYHLVAAQDVNYPALLGNPVATFSLEGCVGSVNPGAFNQIAQNDGAPALSTSCEEVTASYDPNDKTPYPTGWTDEHFIEARTDLEYRIRFQNTGTDTAFNVVIVDTLSPLLDPASIRPGAASHAYTFELSGQGVAKFKFANILLPDSTTNEPASHGFVNFKISQVPDNQPDDRIENTAEIYFDFNPAIVTNTTFHTIHEPWVGVVSGSVETFRRGLEVHVFPNPFFESATFELEGFAQNGTLSLFDLTGHRVLSQNFAAGQTTVKREGLMAGIYFFKMENGQGVLATGKVVVR